MHTHYKLYAPKQYSFCFLLSNLVSTSETSTSIQFVLPRMEIKDETCSFYCQLLKCKKYWLRFTRFKRKYDVILLRTKLSITLFPVLFHNMTAEKNCKKRKLKCVHRSRPHQLENKAGEKFVLLHLFLTKVIFVLA